MSRQADILQERTRRFAVSVLSLLRELPNVEPAVTIRRQLTRCATAVAANYRTSRRARSHAEFTARIGVVAEEADESLFWLSLLCDLGLGSPQAARELAREARELTAIFSTSAATARRNARSRR
jgi:four helix bundle protein